MDHSGHDHSAHAGMDMSVSSPAPMSHDHGAVLRHEDGTYYYTHGAWLGHVVPGSFFVIWGVWWTIATFYEHLSAQAGGKGFRSRPWHPVFFGSARVRRLPLEPIFKIVLPAIGILGELWLGHESYMNLYESDGKFVVDHINDWQHSSMYSVFLLSGLIDLATRMGVLPAGLDSAGIGMCFLAEGLLLVFHLKGPSIEIIVHLILVIQIYFTVVAVIFESLRPTSFVAALARPYSTIVQGVWWIQTAYIMYRAKPQWDPEYMGSTMMAPVAWITHATWIAAAMLSGYIATRVITERMFGWVYRTEGPSYRSQANGKDSGRPSGRVTDVDLEMSALVGDRF